MRPRAARDGVAGLHGGRLRVDLKAPPVDGKANAALARYLGRALSVPPTAIEVVRGATGRDKLVRIEGLTAQAMRSRLESA